MALRAAFAPNLLAASLSERLVLYQDNPRTNFTFPNVVGNIFQDHSQAISPDGRWLAVALADYSIELWSLAEKESRCDGSLDTRPQSAQWHGHPTVDFSPAAVTTKP